MAQATLRTDMDAALQLQLEEVQEFFDLSKGKEREGEFCDRHLALDMYQQELAALARDAADRQMAKSIARAVLEDGPAVVFAMKEEEVAQQDGQLARSLEDNDDSPQSSSAPALPETDGTDDELMRKLAALYLAADSDDSDAPAGESSAANANHSHHDQEDDQHRCEACHESHRFFDVIRGPCGHEYCRDCISDLFEASMTDETLFPPRCCKQDIPPDDPEVRLLLPATLRRDFAVKRVEFETADRIYCADPRCSAFIPPGSRWIEGDVATCPTCAKETCARCKAEAHPLLDDCPADTALQQLWEVAEEQEWQRCYSCGRLVALTEGCYHMTCRCSAQFCYLCGLPWKTCACEQWHPHRLRRRADELLVREPPAHHHQRQALPAGNYAAQLDRMMRELVENHECEHERWRWVGVRNQRCEECAHRLPEYLFECRRCRVRVCNRCRRNRL